MIHFISHRIAMVRMEEMRISGNGIICYLNSSNSSIRDPITLYYSKKKGLTQLKEWMYLPIMYVVRGTNHSLEIFNVINTG